MINSIKAKMPLQSNWITEILLPYEGNPETSWTLKMECQSHCAAISSKWCILAVTFVCHLTKVASFCLVLSSHCVCQMRQNVWCIQIIFCCLKMSYIQEQRVSIKLFSIMGPFSETYEMLQKAFDNEYTSQTQTFEWYKRIKTEKLDWIFSTFWTTIYAKR